MTASAFDSAIWRDALFDRDFAALFTDTAEVRAMMIVLGTLAKVRGEAGEIPEVAAKAIHRASLELQIDPSGLSAGVGVDGDPVAPLVHYFRELMQAPEFAPHVDEGASHAAIEDTAQALRLRQMLSLVADRMDDPRFGDLRDRVQIVHFDNPSVAKGLNLSLPHATAEAALHDLAGWIEDTAHRLTDGTSGTARALFLLIAGLNGSVQAARGTAEARLTRRLCLPQMALALGRILALVK